MAFLKIQELEKLRRFFKMEIEVRADNEVVFNGDADEFLFMQDNDIELENLLDKLESKPYNSIVRFEDLRIEKLLDLLWE